MIITKMALPRRTFLRGLGTTLALPLLDAMFPAMSALAANPAQQGPPSRICLHPDGDECGAVDAEGRRADHRAVAVAAHRWQPHLDHVTVLTNTELKRAYGPGNHATGNAAFLSTVLAKKTEGSDFELATTCDQIAAQAIGKETAIPSLELGTDLIAQVGNCDNGLACVYMNSLSWSSPTTPLPSEADPRVLFERLFGDGGSPGAAAGRASQERQHARCGDRGHGQPCSASSGPDDRTKMNQYLDTVREVERRIQKAEQQSVDVEIPDLEGPLRRAGVLGRPREADVRSAGARAAGRHHARHHVPDGARSQHADLSANRRARGASPDVASRRTTRRSSRSWPRSTRITSRCSRITSRELKATADGDGSLLDHSIVMLGSGLGQPGRARSPQPADRRGGRRGQSEGRPAHQVRRSRRRWPTCI